MRPGVERERRIVLTIVILVGAPGILLSVLGVRYLRSEERLVEDKIRAHYATVAARIDSEVADSLAFYAGSVRDLASRVAAGARTPMEAAEVLESQIGEEPLYLRFYLAGTEGAILYPSGSEAQRVVPMADESHPALAGAHRLEFQERDHAAAIAEYERILTSDPREAGLGCLALVGVARCRRKAGDATGAIEAYRRSIERYPLLADATGTVYGLGARLELAELQRSSGEAMSAAWTHLEVLEFLVDHGPSLGAGQERFYRRRSEEALDPLRRESSSSPAGREVASLLARWREIDRLRAERETSRKDQSEVEALLAGTLSSWLASQGPPPALPLVVGAARGERLLVAAWLRTDEREPPIAALLVELDPRAVRDRILAPALAARPDDPEATILLADAHGQPVLGDPRPEGETLHASPLSGLPHYRLTIVRSAAPRSVGTTGQLLAWAVALSIACILAGLYLAARTVRREVRSARAKSDFVSSVTHELKTPLTAIEIFIETLRSGRAETPEETAQYLEILSYESRSLSRLIGRILDFSKMEEGSKAFRFEAVDPAEVVGRSVELFRSPLDGEGLAVRIDIPDGLPPLRADPRALEEALWNLLDNARKYSAPRSDVELSARIEGGDCRIAVRDRGIGIPARQRLKIFEKFYRVQDERARGVEGTGLGLAIVRHIARAHGGRVEVESEVGQGSTFTLVLPISGPAVPEPTGEKGAAAWKRS